MVNLIAKCDRQSIPVADNQVGFNRWAGWPQAGHLPDGAELGRLGVSDGGGWSISKIAKLTKKWTRIPNHRQATQGPETKSCSIDKLCSTIEYVRDQYQTSAVLRRHTHSWGNETHLDGIVYH